MPALAHALLAALKDHGAHEIFGIPGDFVLPLFKVIEESNFLPNFTLSHEPTVGFAADASARYRGGLGVAVVTYGAGAFNIVNSIAGAYAERSPVVVIAGAPAAHERTSGFLLHHQARTVDTQLAVFKEITCDQAVLTDPVSAPTQIARVLRSARKSRCRSISNFLATWLRPRSSPSWRCRRGMRMLVRSPNAPTRSSSASKRPPRRSRWSTSKSDAMASRTKSLLWPAN
jgi:thiamine pyrophosphate-dependent acetolactate synthase large subunit-like protein